MARSVVGWLMACLTCIGTAPLFSQPQELIVDLRPHVVRDEVPTT